MALLIFFLAFSGASWGPTVAAPLRRVAGRVQAVAATVILAVGLALIYAGAVNPGFWDRLILD